MSEPNCHVGRTPKRRRSVSGTDAMAVAVLYKVLLYCVQFLVDTQPRSVFEKGLNISLEDSDDPNVYMCLKIHPVVWPRGSFVRMSWMNCKWSNETSVSGIINAEHLLYSSNNNGGIKRLPFVIGFALRGFDFAEEIQFNPVEGIEGPADTSYFKLVYSGWKLLHK